MNMKKSILMLASLALITGSILISCNTNSKKVENANNNVIEANDDSVTANKEYWADIENFRKAAADMIEANNQKIAELKVKIKLEKKDAQVAYQEKITFLEQKNSDLKKEIDDYKVEDKEKWEKFKVEFSKDMKGLGTALGDFFHSKNNTATIN